jgi:hypothetical protein
LDGYIAPPQGIPSPVQWGDVATVRQRLGNGVTHLHFERGIMGIPSLSPQHLRMFQEAKAGPFIRTALALQADPTKLAAWRQELDELIGEYLRDNIVRHEYLLTRAIKI